MAEISAVEVFDSPDDSRVTASVHPSSILRGDEEGRSRQRQILLDDLDVVRGLLGDGRRSRVGRPVSG